MKIPFSHIAILILVLFIGISNPTLAQNNNYQLAEQYFKQGEFEKAADSYRNKL